MKNICLLFISFLLTILVFSCQPSPSEDNSADTKSAVPPPPKAVEVMAILPEPVFQRLADSCDRADIIFYESGTSVGGDGENARALLRYVMPEAATKKAGCTATGRIDFMIQGDILVNAEFFADGGCAYFIFSHKGKTYGNRIHEDGVSFFNSMGAR